MGNSEPEKVPKSSNWKVAALTALLTASGTLMLLWFFLQWFSAPTILQYTGYADTFVLVKPEKYSSSSDLRILGEMVKNGTLLSLDDLWTFQSSFYQTIITVLIAINGILAALAFFYIKNTSHDKAIDAAVDHTQQYISGRDFEDRVDQKVQNQLQAIQEDYNSTAESLDSKLKFLNDEMIPTVFDNQNDINKILTEQAEMKTHIATLIKRVSELDHTEQEGGDLTLGS